MFAKIFSAFLLITAVTAKLHDNCACHNGDSYNWRLTVAACTEYNDEGYEWGGATYNETSGRCVQATTEDKIAGDQWEDACRKIAEEGYDCADGEGKCYANPKKTLSFSMTQVFVCNLAILTLSQSILILSNWEEGLSKGEDSLELDLMKDGGHSILRMQERSYFMTAPYQARDRHIMSESWPVEDRAIRLMEEA
ncbi:hypothetical protein BKA60DRAFT_538466 [Fusarium oxysporum]|nr:hypothetical protein BKA60DRAFT_538466 [Fusarium oxysporum]